MLFATVPPAFGALFHDAGTDARLAGLRIHPAGLGGGDPDVRHGAGDTDHAVAAGGSQSRRFQQRLPAGAIAERAAGYAGGGVFAAADCDGDCAAQPAAGDGANDRPGFERRLGRQDGGRSIRRKPRERLAEMPGVEAIAAAWHAPLYGSDRRVAVVPSGSHAAVRTGYNLVSAGYFRGVPHSDSARAGVYGCRSGRGRGGGGGERVAPRGGFGRGDAARADRLDSARGSEGSLFRPGAGLYGGAGDRRGAGCAERIFGDVGGSSRAR